MKPNVAAWLSSPNFAALEIIARAGYVSVIFDAEHGTFDLNDLNRAIPFAKSLGLRVLVKAQAPERAAIQQPLDFGADGIIIPHIMDVEHAREVCGYAKLPPLGDRSLAGGRTMEYGGFDGSWTTSQNSATLCLPMIEHPEALDDVAAILALDLVDGIFIGPGDLFARRGGGGFQVLEFEEKTLRELGRAALAAEKLWMMPAWSEKEQQIAIEEGADTIGVIQEYTAIRLSVEAAHTAFTDLTDRTRNEAHASDRNKDTK
ncbi:MAG: 4-hydroxy-2-oxovalerate aldolase [Subtercola sp.]|nr:4-hydroxy-2-oxovalerate aldolase [Subtercola sp.]